ncbi:MAG: glucosaminidase domain-containing protein [Hyphomonadaceae bacterium]|jgi:hypothetical protein|nr:glucosaminidase domain-containing protein [Hyphomonadaceae bacterium]
MLTAGPAAAKLPDILASPKNAVPECVTPGRLMAYLRLRNPQLDARYEGIATEYMRHGETFGLRWDFAFYQMIVETGALSYWRGNRHGDVKPAQNNFAGLGATGRGEPGDSFPDVASGVRAHLEHLLLYAGRPVDNPIAQRTRNVRDWGVLTPWHQTFTRPITFTDMSAKWAPGTKSYPSMLQTVAERFNAEVCGRPDPQPSLVQEARASSTKTAATAAMPKTATAEPPRPSGADLAQRAIDQAKVEGNDRRSALGVQTAAAPTPPPAPFKVLNAPLPETSSQPLPPPAATAPPAAPNIKATLLAPSTAPPNQAPKAGPSEKTAGARMASAPAAAKTVTETATPPAANQRCRVWTASYGGQKAMIIRSLVDQVVNFTVLDVNEGSEVREAEAFISAYARNGKIAGEYTTQAQALDKAFELCPEG